MRIIPDSDEIKRTMIVCSICNTPEACCINQTCDKGGGGTPGFIEPPPVPSNFDPVAVRGATHGDFAKSSLVIQLLRSTWRAAPMWERMTPAQQTAFDEMALKQVRILYGDPKFKDHWTDISGYGKLGGRDCA